MSKLFSHALIISIICFAATSFACDQADDGDCCIKAEDCTAFVYQSLCAVLPLNKVNVGQLESQKAPAPDFCKSETIRMLVSTAKTKKVISLEGSCECEEDNGLDPNSTWQ